MQNFTESSEEFLRRHIGPRDKDIQEILGFLGVSRLEDLVDKTVPANIRSKTPLNLPNGKTEFRALADLRALAAENKVYRTYIGMGYSDCITPPVIQRNILENPGWYTQYTPYQAEIAQGRLEALLNFQTLVIDMTGMEVANASMLDEGTAAAEAMTLCYALKGRDSGKKYFFVSEACHPQTIDVLRTRSKPLGIELVIGNHESFDFKTPVFGALLQYPASDGAIYDYRSFIQTAHNSEALVVMAADLLSLALLSSPGELGADVAVGCTQRFGVPLGFGGPHAAYFATRDSFKRQVPGRLVGVSKDVDGRNAIRLALQTREQHIRRDKATSNICTAQVLLAIMASMYAVYHGPDGIRTIATHVHQKARFLAKALALLGYQLGHDHYFDTLFVELGSIEVAAILKQADLRQINLRILGKHAVGVSLDETTSLKDLQDLIDLFAASAGKQSPNMKEAASDSKIDFGNLNRKSAFLTHPVFNSYHSETEMLRYIYKLQTRDLSLATSMIPLGSCTMKLNATSEMLPVTWAEFGNIHPFAPSSQTNGYRKMLTELERTLSEVTGFDAISLQPNAGSQGEYAGLLVIRQYHLSRGDAHREVCLIPKSAHGTNPASAVMAGMKVVVVECDQHGNVDLKDLRAKAQEHSKDLSCLMITYPSTHGVFEEGITEICDIIHQNGGQVYMDGANMNAQIGLCRPGDFGPDVCHLNLHKTFCIPHGGGGPGMGPIGVKKHLVQFLPGHVVVDGVGGAQAIGAVSAAPWGSASILPISYMYIVMMGGAGLTKATQVAILNANYIAKRLNSHYPVLYKGKEGFVAHECIFDTRQFKETAGIEVEDIAKRLMDYGFHAPTISFPVAGTMMVEPTESESRPELDRFCDAMISIRGEIAEIENGKADRTNNVLKNAPHTAEQIAKTEWNRPYPREKAAYPMAYVRESKFWPAVGRINNVLGDRTLICSCLPIEAYVT